MTDATWTTPIAPALDDANDLEFGQKDGCRTPARYGAPEAEYERIRQGIGLVDCSYFGVFDVSGPGARELANRACMSAVDQLPINRMMRTFILHEDGSVQADVHVANLDGSYRLLTEGASHDALQHTLDTEADRIDADVEIDDRTEETTILGVDGPFAWELARDLFGMRIIGVRYLDLRPDHEIDGTPVTVYRGGKMGEFSYWIEAPADDAPDLWAYLLDAGEPYDLAPVGYETTELCVLENRFISVDNEAKQADNVLELNTRVMLDRYKDDFRGSDAVSLDTPVDRHLVGMRIDADDAPDPGDPVWYDDTRIGTVANARYSPALDTPIAVAFLDDDYAVAGIDDYTVNGQNPAETVSAPFVENWSLEIRPQETSYDEHH